MVRVPLQQRRPSLAGARPATTRHRDEVRGATEHKPAYKIVVEEALRPKRKLKTSNYPDKTPPPGYSFVPAGDPKLTAQCKEFARQDGFRVYVVSTTKHQDTQLSMEVHRIGYHFPTSILDRATTSLGTSIDRHGRIARPTMVATSSQAQKQSQRKGFGRIDKKALKHLQQKEIDREARQAILDLFPAIPTEDIDVIVDRAFDLASKKVGTQIDDLSLPRRVQLAVVAHIRHIYTDYDNLLKQVPWMKARSMVEQACLEKLALWRGDQDEDPDAMEEILQEVIVIPDDEDIKAEQHGSEHEGSIRPLGWFEGNIKESRLPENADGHFVHYASRSHDQVIELDGSHNQMLGDDSLRAKRLRSHKEKVWKHAQASARGYPTRNIYDKTGSLISPTSLQPHYIQPPLQHSFQRSDVAPQPDSVRYMQERKPSQTSSKPRAWTGMYNRDAQLFRTAEEQYISKSRIQRSSLERKRQSPHLQPLTIFISPEEAVPSIESAIPRQEREPIDRSAEVIRVDYPDLAHGESLREVRSEQGISEYTRRRDNHVHPDFQEHERIRMSSPNHQERRTVPGLAFARDNPSGSNMRREVVASLRYDYPQSQNSEVPQLLREPYRMSGADEMMIDSQTRHVHTRAYHGQPEAESSQVVLIRYPELSISSSNGLSRRPFEIGEHVRAQPSILTHTNGPEMVQHERGDEPRYIYYTSHDRRHLGRMVSEDPSAAYR